jgi:hypothetical protein
MLQESHPVYPTTNQLTPWRSVLFEKLIITQLVKKFKGSLSCSHTNTHTHEGVSKSFRSGRLEWELQMVQLSTTRCSCIASLWVRLVSCAAITLCVASQRVFIVTYSVVQDIIWKADCHSACQKYPFLWNPKVHHRLHTNLPLDPILSQLNPVRPIDPYLPKVHSVYCCTCLLRYQLSPEAFGNSLVSKS